MSLFAEVCDAWVDDLTAHVSALSGSIVHRYAPWSMENLVTEQGERHLAVWPEVDAESTEPLTTDGSRLSTQTYSIIVWEDAAAESARRFDDDDANRAWLDLAEAIRARLMRQGGIQLGATEIMATDYLGLAFPAAGALRVMNFGVRVRVPLTRTA